MRFDTEWERECFKKGAQVIKDMGDLANGLSTERSTTAGMLDAFMVEHRTLQQSIVRHFANMLVEWSKGDKGAMSDLRNEAAWEFAQKVRVVDPVFPLI